MRWLIHLLLAASVADDVIGARILAVLPMPAKSHDILFRAIFKALAARGHQVISYTPYSLEKLIDNFTTIRLDVQSAEKTITKEELAMFMTVSPVAATELLFDDEMCITNYIFENKKFLELIESDEQFDLVILEPFFSQEVLLALGHKFKAPVISVHPFGAFGLVNKIAGSPLNLAYIPDFAFLSSNQMTFYERLLNTYSILKPFYTYYTKYLPAKDQFMRNLFKDPTLPSIVDMVHNTSLIFTNAHPYVHYSQPYTPNLVPIGGIHLAQQKTTLPPALKSFLDEAKHGVIYFSLGSTVPDHVLGQQYYDNFINVFRRLPQRVLWKTGSEHKGLPDNVMTTKWAPQQDVLAHRNVLVFMTHGGIFSQHEAIHAGVPVVCTPFWGEQPFNAKFYEAREVGVILLFNDLSEETIYSALTTVIKNPKYKENMAKLSQIYRDRPISPADSVVFWVEYVLRHRGAQHLRPASATMPWYQLYLLDVLAAFLAVITGFLLVVYLVIKKTLGVLMGRTEDVASSRAKKQN